ncbi:flippase [Dyadobacter diqingensis]|uniref:flippase n=1 Tax=Dyadobacter diqingensis TaxID=2938121 RepID=UPI0020C1B860|nr:flippase [Dyadobacter diqingensis]
MIKKNFVYNVLLSVSQILYPVITFPYASRILGVEGIGLATFCESICRSFMLVAALGIPIYGVREIAKTKNNQKEMKKVFSEIFLIHLAMTLVVSAAYILSIYAVERLYDSKDILFWGLLLVVSNVFAFEWFFMGLEQFKFVTIRTIIIRFISIGLIFFVVKDQDDLLPYFLLIVISSVLNGFINVYYVSKILSFQNFFSGVNIQRHFKSLMYIFGTTFAVNAYTLLDTVLLGFLSSDKSVGFYTSALKLNRVPLTMIGSLGVVLVPKLSGLMGSNNLAEFKRIIDKSLSLIITLSIPVMIGVCCMSQEIVSIFFGTHFAPAAIPMMILSPLTLLIGLSNIFGIQILTPMSKDKEMMKIVLSGAFISLLLNYFLIPVFDENGAAFSNFFTELVVTVATYFVAKRHIDVTFPTGNFLKQLAISLPYILIIFTLKLLVHDMYLRVGVTVFLCLIYFVISQLVFIKNEVILEFRDSMMRKMISRTSRLK